MTREEFERKCSPHESPLATRDASSSMTLKPNPAQIAAGALEDLRKKLEFNRTVFIQRNGNHYHAFIVVPRNDKSFQSDMVYLTGHISQWYYGDVNAKVYRDGLYASVPESFQMILAQLADRLYGRTDALHFISLGQ